MGENRSLLQFVDKIYGREELPVWKEVAALVAALAAYYRRQQLKVKSSVK